MPAVTPTITRSARRIGILPAPVRHDHGGTGRGVGLLRPFGGLLGTLGVRTGRRLALDYLVVAPLVSTLFVRASDAPRVATSRNADTGFGLPGESRSSQGLAMPGLRTHTRIDTLSSRHSTRFLVSHLPALQTGPPVLRTGTAPAVDGAMTAEVERRESTETVPSPDEGSRQAPSGPGESRPTGPDERDATDQRHAPPPTVLSRSAPVHPTADQWRVTRHTGRRSRVLEQTRTRVRTRTRRRLTDQSPARRRASDSTPERGDDAPQSATGEPGPVADRPAEATDLPRLTYATPRAAHPATEDASDPQSHRAHGDLAPERQPAAQPAPTPTEALPAQRGLSTDDGDLDRLADRVYDRFERKLRIERERRGLR